MRLIFYNHDLPATKENNMNQNKDVKIDGAFTYKKYNEHYYETEMQKNENVLRNKSSTNTKGEDRYENHWENISSIYDRFFMFLHLLITIISFFVIYILYSGE